MLTVVICISFGFGGGFCECLNDNSIPLKVGEFLGNFCYFWLFINPVVHVDSMHFIRN